VIGRWRWDAVLLGVLLPVQGACGGGAVGGASGTGGQVHADSGGAGSGGAGGTSSDAGAGGITDAVVDQPMYFPPDGAGADAAAPLDLTAPADAVVIACAPGTGFEQIGTASLRDRATCLVWQRAANATLMTNKQAAKYCDTLAEDGFSDWRVPAPEELATWPNLAVSNNAFITNPIYVPTAGTVPDGCTGNSHSCNLTQYNAGALACAWQGVGFAGPAVCVRGTAAAGTTATKYAAAACDDCKSHVAGAGADFHVADCLPYAN
jgi:hypothetical protein